MDHQDSGKRDRRVEEGMDSDESEAEMMVGEELGWDKCLG